MATVKDNSVRGGSYFSSATYKTYWLDMRITFLYEMIYLIWRRQVKAEDGERRRWRVLVRRAWRASHFFLAVFFRVSLDGLSDRGTTRSLVTRRISYTTIDIFDILILLFQPSLSISISLCTTTPPPQDNRPNASTIEDLRWKWYLRFPSKPHELL